MFMWLSLFGMVCLGALSLAIYKVIVVVYGKIREYRSHDTLVRKVSELEAEVEKLKEDLVFARGHCMGHARR